MSELIYRAVAKAAPGGDPLEYVLSDGSVDRMGDIIEPGGWKLDNFKENPVALFAHDQSIVVGTWANLRVAEGQLRGRLNLIKEGASDITDYVRALVKQKILRAVSVGFSAIKSIPLDPNEPFGPRRFLESELLEASLVAVPANANALQVMKALGIPADASALIFGKLAREDQRAAPAVTASSPNSSRKGIPKMEKSLSRAQRIEAAQKYIVQLKDQLSDLDSRREGLNDDEKALLKELPDALGQAEANLSELERIERALAPRDGEVIQPERRAAGADRDLRGEIERPFAMPKKKVEPVDLLVRAMATITLSASRHESLQQSFTTTYGQDQHTLAVLKAATAPALTTQAGWAAELVETVNAGFLDRLLKDSIYGPLSARGVRFTFGRAGAIRIPSRTNTSKLSGSWVGEAAPKPVKQASFTPITLNPFKLAVISVFSEEIGDHSTPAIEAIIRDAMRDDTSEAIDGYLIDNVAASAARPAGLLNGLSTLTPSAAADKTQAMIADIKLLRQTIIGNGGGRDIVLIMNSAQSTGIDLATTANGLLFNGAAEGASRFGVGLIVSNTVPAARVIAVDAEDFASATGDVPRYAISADATLHMEDTTPLAIASGAQGSGVLATPTRSLFQTDSIAIRMTWPITWAMRRTGMVAFMDAVTW
jgi:HK97 family phage prohead protease/HK97 family phage major capsid protein